jgi:hypothetical protein
MATMYYDKRRRPRADPHAQEGGRHRLRLAGHAHALNLRDSGVDVRVGLRRGSKSRARRRGGGPEVMTWPRRRSGPTSSWCSRPTPAQPASTATIAPHLTRRQDADVRARLQHPLRRDRAAGGRGRVAMVAPKSPGHRVRELFVEGGGTPALLAVHQDATGQAKALALSYAKRDRRHARRRHRDDVRRGDRDRPLRRAGGALRRRERARQGRLRDAGRGRLPARGRLLRVPARAEAHRRPDVPRRPQLHALLGQRHGRTRRLHRRPAHRHRRDEAGDEADAGRDPGRQFAKGGSRRTRPVWPAGSGCSRDSAA